MNSQLKIFEPYDEDTALNTCKLKRSPARMPL